MNFNTFGDTILPMNLQLIRILNTQRHLYNIPRGMDRFEAYLKELGDHATGDIRIPITAMNPMGKEHVAEHLDQLLAINAEDIAEEAVTSVTGNFEDIEGAWRVALVIVDDLVGGWTNRFSTEYSHRFESQAMMKRRWLPVFLWTSEAVSEKGVREVVLTTIYRAAYILRHGWPTNLGEMMKQEGYSLAMAGAEEPKLEPKELEHVAEVITLHLGSQHPSTIIPCLFGDSAADSLGYEALGLPALAGLSLARHQEKSRTEER